MLGCSMQGNQTIKGLLMLALVFVRHQASEEVSQKLP